MTNAVLSTPAAGDSTTTAAGPRSLRLAERLERGAAALAAFAETLTDAEWGVSLGKDARTTGILVHHVGTMYPIEIEIAQTLAAGKPVTGVTWADVHALNAAHARQHAGVSKADALALLLRNSAAAADAIRALTDEELDRAAAVSLYAGDVALTCQFLLEDHAVRHSYHHLAGIRQAVGR